ACSFDLDPTPTPVATPTAITFDPGDVAVGTLLDDASSAWVDVESWTVETRVESSGEGSGDGTVSLSRERVILPNERHTLTMNGETVVTEEITTGDTIYMRGTLVSSSIYPDVDAETWIAFTPDQAPE